MTKEGWINDPRRGTRIVRGGDGATVASSGGGGGAGVMYMEGVGNPGFSDVGSSPCCPTKGCYG